MRILIAFGHTAARLQMASDLQDRFFIVSTAESASQSLSLMRQYRFEAVLIDSRLRGDDALKVQREASRIGAVVIVVAHQRHLSAKADDLVRQSDAYFTTSETPDEAAQLIISMIAHHNGHQGTVVRVGDLAINLEHPTVYRNGAIVELGRREYFALRVLALKKGWPVSVETIRNNVYADPRNVRGSTVTVLMNRLRKRLGGRNGRLYIPRHGARGERTYSLVDPNGA